ncbi:MAG TPA: Fmu (Sun) domain-containing protein [Chitinophagaceae bacterium]|nr:Fmu (Sun) domain-containing protein [Chitinophagaceae bacterium]
MKRYYSYLHTAKVILNRYTGEMPLASFLKLFFAENRKYGSRDRRMISELCYCYFRLGKACPKLPVEDRIVASLFLCSPAPNELLGHLHAAWNDQAGLAPEEKFALLDTGCSISQVFPFRESLSEGIDADAFSASFFTQPDLFLRIRPGYIKQVKEKLQAAGLQFRVLADDAIALPNSSKAESVLLLNAEAVVQDYSSQQIGGLFQQLSFAGRSRHVKVWDCCAASGGKSILAHDRLQDLDLTVSDIRESVLANLKKRFAAAGIGHYHSFAADLSAGGRVPVATPFDLIIADVPCSGSGTWGRTPEQLYYFKPESIPRFSGLQKKIVSHTIAYLRPGGYLLYSTCSVFQQENEAVVDFMQQAFSLRLLVRQLIPGYTQRADTMFAALLQKPS